MSNCDLFGEEIDFLEKALNCKVCNNILEDPLLITKCGHTTCRTCLSKHLDMTCPICSVPVNTKDSLEDKQLKELLVQLRELKTLLNNDSNASQEEWIAPTKTNVETPGRGQHPVSFSTPKLPKCKVSLTQTPVTQLNCEVKTIQETPEHQAVKTPVSSTRGRRPGNKRLSSNTSSVSSPGTPSVSPGNLNKKNHKGETCLHRAVIKGDISKVAEFLKLGASVNTQDNNGWTPLHEASNHGYMEVAKMLLDHGALVNVPSLKDNITPLHDALLNEQMEMAVLLVSRGADLHAKASFGYTALDLCKNEKDKNTVIEACSPFIDADTLIPDSKVVDVKRDKLIFLSSNLNEDQKLKLQKCANMLKAEIVQEFKPEVTHIVTSCDNMGNCTRTMKILLCILSGKWLMNFQWIEVCLEYKQKVDEEVFEVQGTKNHPNTQGPKNGRQNHEQKFPTLFDGLVFYLHGPFNKPTPSRDELCNLIHRGGGKVLSREPRLETVESQPHRIPFHAAGTPLESFSHIILFQEKPPRDTHIHSSHIATSQVMWLVECISNFKLLEPKQTATVEKDTH